MRYARWGIIALILIVIGAFFHYTLPQRDIVRIVNTYEERQDFGINRIFFSSSSGLDNKDVLFIQARDANDRVRVYRNEDTGFWPPYLKFDTANLQTEAADVTAPASDNPKWYYHAGEQVEPRPTV